MPAMINARAPSESTTGSMTPIFVLLAEFSVVAVWRAASRVPVPVEEDDRMEVGDALLLLEDVDRADVEEEEGEDAAIVSSAVLLEGGVVGIVEDGSAAMEVESSMGASVDTTGTEVGPRIISLVAVGCR